MQLTQKNIRIRKRIRDYLARGRNAPDKPLGIRFPIIINNAIDNKRGAPFAAAREFKINFLRIHSIVMQPQLGIIIERVFVSPLPHTARELIDMGFNVLICQFTNLTLASGDQAIQAPLLSRGGSALV